MSQPFRRIRYVFTAASTLGALLQPLAATDPGRLSAGDCVFTACPETELREAHTGDGASLDEGTELRVTEISGDQVHVSGASHHGWLPARRLHKPDDPDSVAALKEFGEVRLFHDRFGAVQRLDASQSHFGGDALSLLKGLYSLEVLELSASRVTNDDLRHLEGLSNLRWLYLDHTSVDDSGLISLRRLVNLEVLVLSQSAVRGPGLAYLHHLRRLRVLNLSDCRIDDAALEHLAGMSQVQTLALENAPIQGHGLKHLQTLTQLNVLNLGGCPLRPGTLLHLKDLSDLRILRARRTPISQEERDALRAANAHLAIFP